MGFARCVHRHIRVSIRGGLNKSSIGEVKLPVGFCQVCTGQPISETQPHVQVFYSRSCRLSGIAAPMQLPPPLTTVGYVQSQEHKACATEIHWLCNCTFLGRCREGMTTTSSLMPAMLIRLPKGLWLFSAAPLAGSVNVSCPVVGIMTSSGIIFISAPKSFLAEKLLALHTVQGRSADKTFSRA